MGSSFCPREPDRPAVPAGQRRALPSASCRVGSGRGSRAGVSGTPAMFINGRLLSGNQPYSEIKALIDDELQRKAAK